MPAQAIQQVDQRLLAHGRAIDAVWSSTAAARSRAPGMARPSRPRCAYACEGAKPSSAKAVLWVVIRTRLPAAPSPLP